VPRGAVRTPRVSISWRSTPGWPRDCGGGSRRRLSCGIGCVIFASGHLDKAFEYGGWPKLVLALGWKQLQRTFREVSADIASDELQETRREKAKGEVAPPRRKGQPREEGAAEEEVVVSNC
jgi:hypothetical protein